MPERTRKVDVGGGVTLSVRDFASPDAGAPGLLLHHGLASTSHIWDLMLPKLVGRFHVVAYDARGHGLSGKPGAGYGFERVSADALAVIRATRLRRPVVVGHSWGAMVALQLAAMHPRSVSGAVLLDGGLSALKSMGAWAEVKQQLAPPHLAGMPVEEFRAAIRQWMPMPVTPLIEGHVLSIMRVDAQGRIHPRLSRANHLRILRAIWEQDPVALYGRLRVPILAVVMQGDGDDLSARRRRDAEAAVKAVVQPGLVRFVWMEGIHDVPLQYPDRLARRLHRFADIAVR
jgi:pimeloyl-ACP methyl ester carboxylesterase